MLKKKTHHVIPVIASDQIDTLLPLVNQKSQHFGFVINSQSEKKPGMHWKAIYFDRKKAEACYFDSLVSEPTEAVMRGIKQIMRKMADPLYFKLKINRIDLYASVRLINFVPSIGTVATGYTNEPNAPCESNWLGGPMEQPRR